jgi:hypothetical protein
MPCPRLPAYDALDQQTLVRSLKFRLATWGIKMGLIPNFNDLKDTYEEAFKLLRRAVDALEKLAAEQERTNDLYAEVNHASQAKTRNSRKV